MHSELLNHFHSKHERVEERMEAGKALRRKISRSDQGKYAPMPNRTDPISILEAQAKCRLPQLVPIRHARMLTSPFAFLRGGAAIMAADLSAQGETSGINVQACGDMHVANFGMFASAERKLIFGINDFDETLPAPWEWDLKRLVASIFSSGRFLRANQSLCSSAVRAAVSSYRKRIRQYANLGSLELWYSTITERDILRTLSFSQQKALRRMADKARARTHLQVLGKLTDLVDNKTMLRENIPFIVRVAHTQSGRPIKEALASLLDSYFASLADDRKNLLRQYRIVDVARKVVGVGSVGTRCWIIFLTGATANDPLFLQIKEAQASVLEPFATASRYANHGQRVVAGQRLIQGAPDIFLGWGQHEDTHFYVRQLRDMKGGVEFDPEKMNLKHFCEYCKLCGWAMALAHAKSGEGPMIAGYVGKSDELDEAMVRFALSYAEQTESDYEALKAAAMSGRIQVAQAK